MAAPPPTAHPPTFLPLNPSPTPLSDLASPQIEDAPHQIEDQQQSRSKPDTRRYFRISPNSAMPLSPRRALISTARKRTGATLYVCNLPENFNNVRLRKLFKPHGILIDVFVPHRPNSMGRRFGFVRMSNSEVAAKTISVLNEFNLEDRRLLVTFARRPLLEQHRDAPRPKTVVAQPPACFKRPSLTGIQTIQPPTCFKRPPSTEIQTSTGNGVEAAASSVLVSKLRWHILAVARSDFDPDSLNKLFISEGVIDISVHSLGCRVFLISFSNEDALKAMEITSWAWLQRWFFHFIPESSFFDLGGRFCWVSIEGLPPKLWSNDTFDRICVDKGNSLQLVHPVTQTGCFLQRAMLLIHTRNLESVNSSVLINFEDYSGMVSFHEWPSDQIPAVQKSSIDFGSDSGGEPSRVADSEDTVSFIKPSMSFKEVVVSSKPSLPPSLPPTSTTRPTFPSSAIPPTLTIPSTKSRLSKSKFKRQLLAYPGPFSSKVIARLKSRGLMQASSSSLPNPADRLKPNGTPHQEPPPPAPDFSKIHPTSIVNAYRTLNFGKSIGLVCRGSEDQLIKELCDMNNQCPQPA